MAANAILIYEKAKVETRGDSLDFDSRHVQAPFYKVSDFYNFFPFHNSEIF